MRLYLDTCFLNRPFDNQSDDRIRLETEALEVVLAHADAGQWTIAGSGVLDLEIARTADPLRREALQEMLARAATGRVQLDEPHAALARAIAARGIGGFDALHLACAVQAGVDVFLTTDDRLVRRAGRMSDLVVVAVSLPLRWLEPMKPEEGEDP